MEKSTEFSMFKMCQFMVHKLKRLTLETPYADYALQKTFDKFPTLSKTKSLQKVPVQGVPQTQKHLLNSNSGHDGLAVQSQSKLVYNTAENFNRNT